MTMQTPLFWAAPVLGQAQPEAAPASSGAAPAFDTGAPVQGGESRPISGAPGGGPPTQAPSTGMGGSMIWILLLFMVLMIAMTSMSGRKEKKRREAMLAAVKRSDRVQTLGGIIGTVVDITPQEVVLRVDEVSNTRIRFARSAVQQVLSEGKDKGRDNGAAIEAKNKGEPASV